MNFGSQVSRVIGLVSKNPDTLPRLSLAYGNLGLTQAPAKSNPAIQRTEHQAAALQPPPSPLPAQFPTTSISLQ